MMLLSGLKQATVARDQTGYLMIRAERDFDRCDDESQWKHILASNLNLLRRDQAKTFALLSDASSQLRSLTSSDADFIGSLPCVPLKGPENCPEVLLLEVSGPDLSVVAQWMNEEECCLFCLPKDWTVLHVASHLRDASSWEDQKRTILSKGGFLVVPMADGFGVTVETFDEGICALLV